MEKKYQVFISSTYEDLKEERKNVTETLLMMDWEGPLQFHWRRLSGKTIDPDGSD